MTHHDVSRRALLLAGVAALAGCSSDPRPGPGERTRNGGATKRPKPPPPPPPAPAAYQAPVGDALPNFKQTAGRFAQALATYDGVDGVPQPLPTSGYVGAGPELAAAAAPLRPPARYSRAEVEFVQYGGLTPVSPKATSGVAMVVLRQVLQDEKAAMTVVRRTLDLRMQLEGGLWQVASVASAGGRPVARPRQLSMPAQMLLDDERVDLPDSARWDVYSGQIAPELLRTMLRLADVARLRATVLKTGHPERVVDGRASAPVSAHFRGRAVDIYALDDVPVAEAAADVIRSVMQTAGGIATVSQVGGPEGFDLDAGRRRYLTNLVHADHLHVAVRGVAG